MTNPLLELVQNARFTPVRLGEGYDMGEVDYFLDRLEAAVQRDEPIGPILDNIAFKEVRLREGYAMEDVDAFLADLRAWRPVPVEPVPVPAVAGTPVAEGIAETVAPRGSAATDRKRGFFARLFGRR